MLSLVRQQAQERRAASVSPVAARDWVQRQGGSLLLAEQAMLVATEIHNSMKGVMEWMQRCDSYVARLQGSPPAGISPYVELDDGLFDYNPGMAASRILGYGAYRSPEVGEQLVRVRCVGLNREFAEEFKRNHVPTVVLPSDPDPIASISHRDVGVHRSLTGVLRALCGEQAAPDVKERLSVDQVALTVIICACRWLGQNRPSDSQLFIVGVATELEEPLSDDVLIDRAKRDGGVTSRTDMDRVAMVNQLEVELSRAEDRWKHRCQTTERRIKSLMPHAF